MSAVSFACFQLIPRPIIGLFGEGSEMYFQFAEKYFRIYLFFTFLNCVQPIASNLFTAIGKPKKGIFLSLTRQILFLLPLIVILPLFIGIDGIMYAGPIADFVAGVVALAMAGVEVRAAAADGKCVRACIGGWYILASPSYIEVRRTG